MHYKETPLVGQSRRTNPLELTEQAELETRESVREIAKDLRRLAVIMAKNDGTRVPNIGLHLL